MASPSLALIQVGEKPWNYTRILWAGISLSAAAGLYLIPTQANPVMAAAVAACLASFFVFALSFYGVRTGWATPFNVKPMV
jgi:hypothetical protein